GREHGDDLRALHRLGGRLHREAVGLGLDLGGAAGAQADGDVETGVAQVERMRAALAAVADDGDAGFAAGHCGVPEREGRLLSGRPETKNPAPCGAGFCDSGVGLLLAYTPDRPAPVGEVISTRTRM